MLKKVKTSTEMVSTVLGFIRTDVAEMEAAQEWTRLSDIRDRMQKRREIAREWMDWSVVRRRFDPEKSGAVSDMTTENTQNSREVRNCLFRGIMTKKECEHLGYLLADYGPGIGQLRDDIFAMDSRIEAEYNSFSEVNRNSELIQERTEFLMEKYNGAGWGLTKKSSLEKTWTECENEVLAKQLEGDL
ncbi:MAG: hypothetical protein GY757_19075 [bacterium]|nr:hypothetical protein [bacterium]